jgi:hypothetical protein
MVNIVEVTLDLVVVTFSLGLSFYTYHLSRSFRGGWFEHPFKVLTISALLFAVAESLDVVKELTEVHLLANVHILLEAAFVLLLFYVFRSFHKSWGQLKNERGS